VQGSIAVTVNGQRYQEEVDTRMLLVHFLRERLTLTGTHVGCTTGNCGACTVLLDGQTVKSCCVLAADIDGASATTIEALSSGASDLHPIQEAFVANQGLQCGFCTPGMVLSAMQLLSDNPQPTEQEVRHSIAGNLCRCTGYKFIVQSIMEAARQGGSLKPERGQDYARHETPA
jgi:carbon-monoxide dehydrogenase small subunit